MPALSTRDEATSVFVNMGKAIASYERTIDHTPSRFDRYVDALRDTGRAPHGVLSADEVGGLRLFIGKASARPICKPASSTRSLKSSNTTTTHRRHPRATANSSRCD